MEIHKKPYRFCPVCASDLQIVEHDRQPVPTCSNQACGFIFWQNAKPATVGVIENDNGEVLLTIRAIEPYRGTYDWPGGFCFENELPEDGVRRELREELGVQTEIVAPLGHALDQYGDTEYLVLSAGFVMRITGGDITINEELADTLWVHPNEVDHNNLAFYSTPYFLDRYVTYANSR